MAWPNQRYHDAAGTSAGTARAGATTPKQRRRAMARYRRGGCRRRQIHRRRLAPIFVAFVFTTRFCLAAAIFVRCGVIVLRMSSLAAEGARAIAEEIERSRAAGIGGLPVRGRNRC